MSPRLRLPPIPEDDIIALRTDISPDVVLSARVTQSRDRNQRRSNSAAKGVAIQSSLSKRTSIPIHVGRFDDVDIFLLRQQVIRQFDRAAMEKMAINEMNVPCTVDFTSLVSAVHSFHSQQIDSTTALQFEAQWKKLLRLGDSAAQQRQSDRNNAASIVADKLDRVREQAEAWVDLLADAGPDEVGVALFHLLLLDLIGSGTKQARVLRRQLSRPAEILQSAFFSSHLFSSMVFFAVIVANICFVAATVAYGSRVGGYWQDEWLIVTIVSSMLDVFVHQTFR
jgi:hypothetical protein